VLPGSLCCPGRLRSSPHRADDVLVAGAAAQIAFQALPDLCLGRVGVLPQQVRGGHDHAGRAVPALQRVLLPECGLQWVPFAITDSFDRGDLGTVCLHRKYRAAFYRHSVHVSITHEHRAGTAVRGVAAHGSAGLSHDFSQVVDEQQSWLDVVGVADAVDLDGNAGHAQPPRRRQLRLQQT
jgi:hypothetical protein